MAHGPLHIPSAAPPALEDQTLREALQMHRGVVDPGLRLELLAALGAAGLRRFQVGSMARPDRMPQMADTDLLGRAASGLPGLEIWVMVFNRRGLERAVDSGFRHVALTASLSSVHSRANLGCDVARGLERCAEMAESALSMGLWVRMGLQCAFGGPLLSPPDAPRLLEVLRPFHAMGVRRLALADTAGRATPRGIARAMAALGRGLPGCQLGLHLHGDAPRLRANLAAAVDAGAHWLDVTLDGLGGCPFLPSDPPGNLPIGLAAAFLAGRGAGSGVDAAGLARASSLLERMLHSGAAPDRQYSYIFV